MDVLVIKQKLNGQVKTWKLNPYKKTVYSFGRSLKSDIKSFDSSHAMVEGAFIFEDNQWIYQPLITEEDQRISLSETLEFKLSNSILNSYRSKKKNIFSIIYNLEDQINGQDWVIVLRKSSNKEFEPEFYNKDDYSKSLYSNLLPLNSIQFHWSKKSLNDSEIYIRLAKLETNHTSFYKTKMIYNKNKFIFVSFILVIFSSISFFTNQNKEEINTISPSSQIAQQILKTDFKKVKKKIQEQHQKAQSSKSVADSQAQESPKGSTQSLFFKGQQNQRVSTLLSKISALSARSKNLILSHGVKAGTERSGRALSVLGSINQKGTSFTQNQIGEGTSLVKFGTISGSLKNTGGLATIKSGKSGVGLLDDESDISGGLDKDIIAEVIRTNLGQILYCYERQLSASPDLFGKVSVRFTIGASGIVETQQIGETSLKNVNVENCILSKVSKWAFPKPKGGMQVLVTYPFLFKSTQ